MVKAFDIDLNREVNFDADATPVIVSVCCVCGKYLGVKDGEGVIGLSHTYCCKCSRDLLAELI
jgi:hypothetical protein